MLVYLSSKKNKECDEGVSVCLYDSMSMWDKRRDDEKDCRSAIVLLEAIATNDALCCVIFMPFWSCIMRRKMLINRLPLSTWTLKYAIHAWREQKLVWSIFFWLPSSLLVVYAPNECKWEWLFLFLNHFRHRVLITFPKTNLLDSYSPSSCSFLRTENRYHHDGKQTNERKENARRLCVVVLFS